jgi:Ricin-type beta-trefoil lectin domain/Lysozyme like domain
MFRQSVGAAAVVGLLLTAGWAGHLAVASHVSATPNATQGARAALPADPGRAVPGLHIRLSARQLASAAGRCARWASNAGFANTGYVGGWLTTAVAIALAESGCDPEACFDDTTGQACTAPGPSADSVDRGPWQLNSKSWRHVSDACAFTGPCAAQVAYLQVSAYGTYFALWSTYDADSYARYLAAAQKAVNALPAGTVTSGLIGSCLAHPADRAGGRVRLENCGTGATAEIWLRHGTTLQTRRGLCMAVRNQRPAAEVLLLPCDGRAWQKWRRHTDGSLYNSGAHQCLNDPGGSVQPGLEIDDLPCNGQRNQVWFLP